MKILIVVLAAVAVVAAAGWGLASTGERADTSPELATIGPTEASCTLPRFGYVTCQREIVKDASQRLEISVVGDADAEITARATSVEEGSGSSRNVGPGETRILLNEGSEGTFDVQVRTSIFAVAPQTTEIDVVVID